MTTPTSDRIEFSLTAGARPVHYALSLGVDGTECACGLTCDRPVSLRGRQSGPETPFLRACTVAAVTRDRRAVTCRDCVDALPPEAA